jgi:hypothetical protein
MAYGFTDKQLQTWEWPAQAAAWRERAIWADSNARHWRGLYEATQKAKP